MKSLAEDERMVTHQTVMCAHDLKDPVSARPYQMATTVMGSKGLALKRSVRECPGHGSMKHQHLQGHLPNGVKRSTHAKNHNKNFAKALAGDIHQSLRTVEVKDKVVGTEGEQATGEAPPRSHPGHAAPIR